MNGHTLLEALGGFIFKESPRPFHPKNPRLNKSIGHITWSKSPKMMCPTFLLFNFSERIVSMISKNHENLKSLLPCFDVFAISSDRKMRFQARIYLKH